MLYSNRPKFKEDLRENIHSDKIRTDGFMFLEVDEAELKKIITQIRINAKKELLRQFKMLAVSIFITFLIILSLQEYLDQIFN